ncbi:hypothetical protein KP509_07G086500 [Ceratopteris richardii]|uniref:BRX domain-containing protein n=1 Tax=Ceratopteris richardii TaxID=49495 RepID=A0A8T2UND9_CERRI|nr:hypothetical protein KP509_07G086500 [Ceratopteris richardii]KAH7433790.1 hypothetical protein KP509_07G086500 [Ceratopteris richardii]
MLVCLACPKQATLAATATTSDSNEPIQKSSENPTSATAGSRDHTKSFTTQLKDIVIKFSTGAYRHCRPCTALGMHGHGGDESAQILYADGHEKSSTFPGSGNEENKESSEPGPHRNSVHDHDEDHSVVPEPGSSASSCSVSRLRLLPINRSKRRHYRKNKSPSSKSPLSLKQLPSHPITNDAIEELLNAHFRREERILAEEQASTSGYGANRDSVVEQQLLEEAHLVISCGREEDYFDDRNVDEDDGQHLRRNRRHMGGESASSAEEWVAQVEPGVMITFVALPDGTNYLKRIRFSRELFSKWQAQLWWAENNEMVRELYSVTQTDAPFRGQSSALSCTTSSSHPQNTLQNTPEVQSRIGSCHGSPSDIPRSTMVDKRRQASPTAPGSCMVQLPPTRLSCDFMDRHDNPLYANLEFELCYNDDDAKDSVYLHGNLWDSIIQEHLHRSKEEDNHALVSESATSSTCMIIPELTGVTFKE